MDVRIYGWDELLIPPTQYCFLLVIWTFLLLSTPRRLLGGKGCLLKCKPTIRGLPEIKRRITHSQYKRELDDDRSRNPACFMQGIRASSCDPPRTLKYYEFTSGLNSSISLFFYTLRPFAGNPKRKLLTLTFGLLRGWVIQQLCQYLQKQVPFHLNHFPLQRAYQEKLARLIWLFSRSVRQHPTQ